MAEQYPERSHISSIANLIIDRRVKIISAIVIVVWALTIFGWFWWWTTLNSLTGNEIPRDIFAAWTGELLFFTVVGLVVAVITLREPAQENFNERVRILYGGGNYPQFVLDKNANEIRRLGGFSHIARRSMRILEYSQTFNAYKIETRTEYEITNMFRDVDYEDTIRVGYVVDAFTNPPPEIGYYSSIKIGSQERLNHRAYLTVEGFNATYDLKILKASTETLVLESTIWNLVEETQRMQPQRPVGRFSMDIVSQIDEDVILETEMVGMTRVNLTYGNRVAFPDVHGVLPDEAIFVFKLLAPPLASRDEEQ